MSGATIQLYAVGTTGDGSAATPLLSPPVLTDANGNFSLAGLYSCGNATEVYITATGGNPGLTGTNPNLALMTALGPCSALTSSTYVTVNEKTTVAAVSALAPFMASASSIGSGTADATILASTFVLSSGFVNPFTGASPGPSAPVDSTVPTPLINTLADLLSTCVNSTGGVAGDPTACGQLFTVSQPAGGAAPTNTIAAMLNIAADPGLNPSSIFDLVPATGPFQPTITSSPATFMVALLGVDYLQTPTYPALFFGSWPVGSTSGPVSLPILTGSTPFSVSLVGINASDFQLKTNGCGTPTQSYSLSCS